MGLAYNAYGQVTAKLPTSKKHTVHEGSSYDRKASLVDSMETIVVCSPLRKPKTTSSFGIRRHPVTGRTSFHNGVDLTADDPVVMAMYRGIVVETGEHPLLGIFIRIDHGGVHSIYGHLSACVAAVGDKVRAGQDIGILGRTGRATGIHLHFSVRIGTHYIDPIKFLLELQGNF
ncbi:M23 family metallopeptidase [Sphingobacterium bambusae]